MAKYQEMQDIDIFDIQTRLEFPEKLDSYFSIISQSLAKNHIHKLESIIIKIKDYVMSKIYDKIFVIEPCQKDVAIYQQSIQLSWTRQEHFIKKKMIFGSFLKDVSVLFNNIDTEKSPSKKLSNLDEIFNSIGFLLRFNKQDISQKGVDDQVPILTYALVQSQPLKIYSNSQFMELYNGKKSKGNEGSQLAQLHSSCDFVANIKPSKLYNIGNEEFYQNCNKAII